MENDAISNFIDKLKAKLDGKFTFRTEIDNKGVNYSWCTLEKSSDIIKAAELVAEYKGRIITISPINITRNEKPVGVEINYHFYFEKINCTVKITVPDSEREVNSITPILKSADWHEREMQEFYQVKLIGHPNPKELFLSKALKMKVDTMVPLSAAMNGSSTSTLWERIMKISSVGDEVE